MGYDGIVVCPDPDMNDRCAWGVSRPMLAYSSPVLNVLFNQALAKRAITAGAPPIIYLRDASSELEWLGKIVQRLDDPFRIRKKMPAEMVWRTTVLAYKYQCLRAVSTTLSTVILNYKHRPSSDEGETMWMILSSYAIGDVASFSRLTHQLAMTWESNRNLTDLMDLLLARTEQNVIIPIRLIGKADRLI